MKPRSVAIALLAVLWVLLPGAGRVWAASGDYLIDLWDTEQNLPSSTVTAIAQTPDGFLWVGTYDGLARFDGVRFVTFDPANTPELSHTRIQGLFLDARGTLWINTFRGGLTSYRNGAFHLEWPDTAAYDLHTRLVASTTNSVTFVMQFGEVMQRDISKPGAEWKIVTPPPGSRPIFQCADHENRLWFLTRDGHILRFAAGKFEVLPQDGGLAGKHIYTLAVDGRNNVWAGAEGVIARWDGQAFADMTPTNSPTTVSPTLIFPFGDGDMWVCDGDRFREMKHGAWVNEAVEWRGLMGWASGRAMGAHQDRDGGIWFNHYGNGLFHVTPAGKFQRLTSRDGLPGDRVGAWFQSSDGGVWMGVDRGGLARLRDRYFHVLGVAEGLTVRTALSVCEDTKGAIWIGTSGGGLCRWQDERMTPFPVGGSASANFVFSVWPKADGGLWLSAAEGEEWYQLQDNRLQRVPWEMHGIKSILADHDGNVWLGTKSGIVEWSGNQRRLLGTNDAATTPSVRALALAPDGTVWGGADDGTLYHCTAARTESLRPEDALAEQPLYSLLADRDGTVWAGTFRGGLLRYTNGQFFRFTAKQGLPVDVISQILEDDRGRLWLGTHQGIYCVSKAVLNACANGEVATVDYVAYGRHDGLPALECSDGYQPACWRGANGRLWFTTVRGVVWVNPDELTANAAQPPVKIEEFRVDGEQVVLNGGPLRVPPGRKQFDLRFTALNFDGGEKTRFRYQLEGFDPDWVKVETLRTAHYTRLQPHTYRFHVTACNNQGIWNETGDSLTFTVEPYFYQTTWFAVLATVLTLGALVFTVRKIATTKYRRRLARLEQQHAIERDRARIAKDIHDDIGAGLTQITLLTELARREPEQVGGHLDKISGSARKLTRAMDEIVWAVDPQHDTFDGLMDYISAYAEDYLRTAGIRCRMDLPVALPAVRVDAELRYNLFLALKEALNNVVKHAQATEVWLRLKLEPDSFALVIEDNGVGMASAHDTPTAQSGRLASGSGMGNLAKRIAAVGGRCTVRSFAGQGTQVEFYIAFGHGASPIVAIGPDPMER